MNNQMISKNYDLSRDSLRYVTLIIRMPSEAGTKAAGLQVLMPPIVSEVPNFDKKYRSSPCPYRFSRFQVRNLNVLSTGEAAVF